MVLDQSLDIHEDSLFDRLIVYVATAFFCLNLVFVFAVVVGRQFSFINVQSLQPIGRYTLVVAVYLGAAVASRNRQHISIQFVMGKIAKRRPRLKYVLDLVASALVSLMVILFVVATGLATRQNWGRSLADTALVDAGHVYFGIFVGLAIMAVYELMDVYGKLQSVYGMYRPESDPSDTSGEI